MSMGLCPMCAQSARGSPAIIFTYLDMAKSTPLFGIRSLANR